jgi:hypothetical protein
MTHFFFQCRHPPEPCHPSTSHRGSHWMRIERRPKRSCVPVIQGVHRRGLTQSVKKRERETLLSFFAHRSLRFLASFLGGEGLLQWIWNKDWRKAKQYVAYFVHACRNVLGIHFSLFTRRQPLIEGWFLFQRNTFLFYQPDNYRAKPLVLSTLDQGDSQTPSSISFFPSNSEYAAIHSDTKNI